MPIVVMIPSMVPSSQNLSSRVSSHVDYLVIAEDRVDFRQCHVMDLEL